MTPSVTRGLKEPPSAELPSDLYTLMGERTLISLALQAVDAVATRLPRWENDTDSNASPRMLLTLLTYSYAAGTYASEDVEWACQHREGARYITGNVRLDEDTLRHFRRANRPWIEECLAWVLERVCERMPHLVATDESRETEPGNPTEPAFLQHARRRVELATLMDMALAD